ncbi:MAG: hypothetical protein KJO04_09350 [Bacteroidia bacterium]|nr:hypothetical protein [Bacteroidia bacterium]
MIALLILMMGLYACSSQKKLTADAPFTVSKAICQTWIGGMEQTGHGTEVTLTLDAFAMDQITLKELYFRGRVGEITMGDTTDGIQAKCNFFEQPKEIAMHSDPAREVGNQPPRVRSKKEVEFPFELKPDEAVISYMENDSLKFFKVGNVVDKPGRVYQSRPNN